MAEAVLRGVPCGASAEPHAHAPGRRRRLWLLQASKSPLRATCAPPGGGRLAIWLSARTRVCKGGNNVVLRRAALLHRAIGSRHGCRSASAPLRGAARHQRGARVRRWATLYPTCRPALQQNKPRPPRVGLCTRGDWSDAPDARAGEGGQPPLPNSQAPRARRARARAARHAPRAASAPRFGGVTKKGSDRPTFLSPT